MNSDYIDHLAKRGFELKEQIGSGLSGGTYRGVQKSLNRNVAIKFFDSSYSKNDDRLRKRFVRESRILALVEHPSIPYIITKGSLLSGDEDIPYLVMQYIHGSTLENCLKNEGLFSVKKSLQVAMQILDALKLVHSKGVVHRDIKPSNIMILPTGHCFLIDFSIGYKKEEEPGFTRATRSGDHLGSMLYMPPEQLKDMSNLDSRSDIYSLTKIICEMITGKPEITAIDNLGTKVNSNIRGVLNKACSYDVNERYSTAEIYFRELRVCAKNVIQLPESPCLAVCTSKKCPSAHWGGRGYYKGPNFIEGSTNLCCTSCGHSLRYRCEKCDLPILNSRYCGGCGSEQYSIPECKLCGSFLKLEDMENDTLKLGCSKCRQNQLLSGKITIDSLTTQTWPSILERLDIRGILQHTAQNCVYLGKVKDIAYFLHDVSNTNVYDASHQIRLADILSNFFGDDIKVQIQLAAIPDGIKTPAQISNVNFNDEQPF